MAHDPTDLPPAAGVVIAGAGIAGIATAHALAEHHGVSDVLVVDPQPPLTLTSDKSGANYRDWWPRPEMVTLARRSIELMERLAVPDGAFSMNRRGYLYVTSGHASRLREIAQAPDEAGAGPIRRHQGEPGPPYASAHAEGITGLSGADVLGPDLVRSVFPHLSPGITGAIHARRAGSMDTAGLGRELLARARRKGVRIVRGAVTGVRLTGDAVESVTVTAGAQEVRIATSRFVNAAGPFAAHVARLAKTTLPVETVLQQKVLVADPLRAVPRDAPFTICLDTMDLEVSAADRRRWRLEGELPAGLHIKPDGSGDRPLVKLGWAFNEQAEPPRWEPACPPGYPRIVLLAASRIVPALAAYLGEVPRIVSHDGGYYVKTPDDLPLIGPAGPEGVFAVTGLAGFGAMVACAVGEIAATWITGGKRGALAEAFAPARFDGGMPAAPLSRERTGAL